MGQCLREPRHASFADLIAWQEGKRARESEMMKREGRGNALIVKAIRNLFSSCTGDETEMLSS